MENISHNCKFCGNKLSLYGRCSPCKVNFDYNKNNELIYYSVEYDYYGSNTFITYYVDIDIVNNNTRISCYGRTFANKEILNTFRILDITPNNIEGKIKLYGAFI